MSGFKINVDGAGIVDVIGINLSAVVSLPGVATAINTALATAVVAATCTWDSVRSRFVFTSSTTGAASTITFLTPGAGGSTDISELLLGAADDVTSGAFLSQGLVAETALAAVTLFDNTFGQQFFGLTVVGSVDADSEAIAQYVEGAANFHYFGVTSQEAGVITPGNTTNIAYIISTGRLLTADDGAVFEHKPVCGGQRTGADSHHKLQRPEYSDRSDVQTGAGYFA